MVKITFHCYGHENLLAGHRKTYEFTKEKRLTKKGDCIVGVSADFDAKRIKKLLKFTRADLQIFHGSLCILEDTFLINRSFSSNKEIVIRRSEFISKRTLGTHAKKSSYDIDRAIMYKLKDPKAKLKVIITAVR